MTNLAGQPLEQTLGCDGYYGFGGGYLLGKFGPSKGPLYCDGCPLKAACWEKHKARCGSLFPELVAELERRAKSHKGPELVKKWHDDFGCYDPYMLVMLANLKDGTAVGAGQSPADRGSATIIWPFPKEAA